MIFLLRLRRQALEVGAAMLSRPSSSTPRAVTNTTPPAFPSTNLPPSDKPRRLVASPTNMTTPALETLPAPISSGTWQKSCERSALWSSPPVCVITRLLRPGDEVVTGDDLYGGTNRLLKYLSTNGGIIVHHVDTTDPSKVKDALTSRTAMVLLETPTNPLIKIVDIPTIASLAHTANPSCLVSVDNTMLSPLLQNPLDLGADIVYESGTKYLSGHHDLMAGVLAVNDPSIGDKLFFTINASGCGLSPFDSWLLMRGVKTLKVRMDTQQANAMLIARFLESSGFRVRYPGLESHPQYDLHNSMARGAGAVLSFETGDVGLSERIVESAKLWAISVSFGCVNSLISMPCRMSHASIDEKTRRERGVPEDLIRLCVGIEDGDDLLDDLKRAVSLSLLKALEPTTLEEHLILIFGRDQP